MQMYKKKCRTYNAAPPDGKNRSGAARTSRMARKTGTRTQNRTGGCGGTGKLAYLRVSKSSRNIMDTIERIARRNRLRAEEVIRDSRLAEIWRSVGAEVRQVGSLRSGLLMKHRDIDFHIYSSPLRLEESFAAMTQLAADPAVGRIECRNLLATDEACVEWHATYRDRDGDEWQLDMIHIVRGSRYDGYFERVADRIAAALTPVTRRAILQLKYDTPDEVKIAGIEYYVAVLRDGVRTYDAFAEWRRTHPLTGIVEWMP